MVPGAARDEDVVARISQVADVGEQFADGLGVDHLEQAGVGAGPGAVPEVLVVHREADALFADGRLEAPIPLDHFDKIWLATYKDGVSHLNTKV